MFVYLRPSLCFFYLVFSCTSLSVHAQRSYSFATYVYNDPKIRWAAEFDAVVNLSPLTNTVSLKKHFLDKMATEPQKAYRFNGKTVTDSFLIKAGSLGKQTWQQDYYVYRSQNHDRWEFVNRKDQTTLRIEGFTPDSCCGCDDADAFLVKQALVYEDAAFTIQNYLFSPLCARTMNERNGAWYAPAWMGLNTTTQRPKATTYLTTTYHTYNIDPFDSVKHFSMLSVGEDNIMSAIFDDLQKGKLKAYDPDSGTLIPVDELLTWKSPIDTVMMVDDSGKESWMMSKKVHQPSDFKKLRLVQEWWFDFKQERLYSEVKKVIILRNIYDPYGEYLGQLPFIEVRK